MRPASCTFVPLAVTLPVAVPDMSANLGPSKIEGINIIDPLGKEGLQPGKSISVGSLPSCLEPARKSEYSKAETKESTNKDVAQVNCSFSQWPKRDEQFQLPLGGRLQEKLRCKKRDLNIVIPEDIPSVAKSDHLQPGLGVARCSAYPSKKPCYRDPMAESNIPVSQLSSFILQEILISPIKDTPMSAIMRSGEIIAPGEEDPALARNFCLSGIRCLETPSKQLRSPGENE